MYILLLSLFYISNSWFYISMFNSLLKPRYSKNIYTLTWLIQSSIIIIKQFSKLVLFSNTLSSIFSIMMLIFQVAVVFCLYTGTKKEKIIVLCIPSTISVFIDILVMELCISIFHMSIDSLSRLTLENVTASGIVSLLTIILYSLYLILYKKKRNVNISEYNELFILAILNLIIFIPSILIYNNITKIRNILFYVVLAQFGIIALISIFSFMFIIHNKMLMLNEKYHSRELQKELEYYSSILKSTDELRKLRHDTGCHLMTIQIFLQEKNFKQAIDYVNSLCVDISTSKDLCLLDDKLLSIIISEKLKKARELGINMRHIIITSPFFYELFSNMQARDKVALFTNLLDNSICAATQATEKYIFLQIKSWTDEQHDCVQIECRNLIPLGQELLYKKNGTIQTTKSAPSNHGIGLSIIRDIVRKYNGSFNLITDTEFTVRITFERREQ